MDKGAHDHLWMQYMPNQSGNHPGAKFIKHLDLWPKTIYTEAEAWMSQIILVTTLIKRPMDTFGLPLNNDSHRWKHEIEQALFFSHDWM